ncbi:ECF transporter S component [Listeria swaminathanii]|uniref:Riboflavin transporter n=1 Tax=Listeria swaminathanii TaxID=2713501 RepID=A0A7X1A0X3_9LIST|nr:ECF transporter S component [Listeria swaminathanii]MCD2248381.1 ECF transporter S component [Listeria marthii]MBC2329978.1 ECF transporter S component [Listeria swaminathanii]MDT0017659.1 ECF transporter S component [Listeria swaminathanii]MDT0022748.1 ECF transporter S component [Listeria swaminathanii]MDT0033712.1 ECF transporter S component [Listeria swaminathanii]
MKNYSMKVFVSVAVLGTLAFILMMLQFPLLPSAPFLKLDFSDIPALIGGLLFGPLAVILVELIKNVLLYIVSGSPVGVPVGELANFISGIFYVLPIYYLFHWLRSTKGMILSTGVGTLLMTIAMAVFNYFILLPFYIGLGGLPKDTDINWLVTYAIVPFNLLKGVIVSTVFLLLYSRLRKWITKNQSVKERRKFEKRHQATSR